MDQSGAALQDNRHVGTVERSAASDDTRCPNKENSIVAVSNLDGTQLSVGEYGRMEG